MEAKRLFVRSGHTVAEVSTQLQFADPPTLPVFFKRETGLSPTQFKDLYREKYQLSRSL